MAAAFLRRPGSGPRSARAACWSNAAGVKSNLIKDEDLGGDEPNCETNHQRA